MYPEPREPDLMQVLKKLAAEGLLNRAIQPGSQERSRLIDDRW